MHHCCCAVALPTLVLGTFQPMATLGRPSILKRDCSIKNHHGMAAPYTSQALANLTKEDKDTWAEINFDSTLFR